MSRAVIIYSRKQKERMKYMSIEILLDRKNRCLVMLSGEIDHHNAARIRMKIDVAIDTNCPSEVFLDFSNVTFMDSSGIGLVMGRYRILREYGATLYVANCKGAIRKVMQLSGMNRLAKFVEGDLQSRFVSNLKEVKKNEQTISAQ